MVEIITEDDIPWLTDIVYEFNDLCYKVPLNRIKLLTYLHGIVHNTTGVGFRTESGFILGMLEEDTLRDVNILSEHGWYTRGSDGIKLLIKFHKHAEQIGVDEVRMSSISNHSKLNKLLTRFGYSELQRVYLKKVK